MSQDVIKIDGGLMEGGGQILRMAVAFSALLKKPINVYNIRAGRSTPGLRPQHLAGLNLVRDLCNGNLIGAEVGSTEITFHPSAIVAGKYSADPGTAGSVMLLFQVSFPCLLFANGPSELHFRGGTNADMAPQIDHTIMVFKPLIEKLGAKFNCYIRKRGYYPKGGGEVVISVTPVSKHLNPIELLKPAEVVDIKGRSFVAGVLPVKVAHGMADAASRCLRAAFPGIPMKIDRVKESPQEAEGNGSGIVLVAKTASGCLIGGSALGKRGVQADAVGETAAKEILEDVQNQACVDRHVQDQLVIFMALAKGQSKVVIGKPTLHTETAIYIAELMTEAKFNIHQDETGQYSIMECTGIGLER
ncbi:RNA 3'-terminal phosphate cyclase, partial [Stegodyphus mimosarum]